jgi:chromosome segregation ATPase
MRRSNNVDDSHADESDSDATLNDAHGNKKSPVSNTNTHGIETHDKSASTELPEKTAATDLGEVLTRIMKSAKEQVESLSTDLQELEKYHTLVDMDSQRHEVSRLERKLQNLFPTIDQRDIQIKKLSQEISTKDQELADEQENSAQLVDACITQEDELELARKELASTRKELESTRKELESTRKELDSTKKEMKSTRGELNSTQEELQSLRELVVGVQKVFRHGSEQRP